MNFKQESKRLLENMKKNNPPAISTHHVQSYDYNDSDRIVTHFKAKFDDRMGSDEFYVDHIEALSNEYNLSRETYESDIHRLGKIEFFEKMTKSKEKLNFAQLFKLAFCLLSLLILLPGEAYSIYNLFLMNASEIIEISIQGKIKIYGISIILFLSAQITKISLPRWLVGKLIMPICIIILVIATPVLIISISGYWIEETNGIYGSDSTFNEMLKIISLLCTTVSASIISTSHIGNFLSSMQFTWNSEAVKTKKRLRSSIGELRKHIEQIQVLIQKWKSHHHRVTASRNAYQAEIQSQILFIKKHQEFSKPPKFKTV